MPIDRATVSARVVHLYSSQILAEKTTEMSTDLPAENLGELVASAIETAWKQGYEPLAFHVVLSFG